MKATNDIKRMKGAIFDLDGTIVDSMGMWYSLYGDYLSAANVEPTEELVDFLRSASIPMAAEKFASGFIKKSKGQIEKELFETIADYYENHPKVKANADKLIKALYKKGVKMSVATQTESRYARAALLTLDLLQYFDGVFSCKDLKIEKDKPDIYYTALSHIDTKKCETVIFEDACHAVKTAKGADFYVIAIEEETVADKETVKNLADRYIKDYKEIIDEL